MKKMRKAGDTIRQGDVLLLRATKAAITSAHSQVQREDGGVVLANGKVTGHRHQLREAVASTFGLRGADYHPLMET
jgi:hypothetical protein